MNNKSQNVKNAIKRSLTELIEKENVSKFSVKEICGKADITQQEFYRHYANRQVLIESFAKEQVERVSENFRNCSEYTALDVFAILLGDIREHFQLYKFFFDNKESAFIDGLESVCMNALYRNGQPLDTARKIYSAGGLCVDDEEKTVVVDGEKVSLTPTEYRIVLFLVKNAGVVFSNEEIYRAIWSEEEYTSRNTIAVHVCRLRKKIEKDVSKPKYLKIVWGFGYKIEYQ